MYDIFLFTKLRLIMWTNFNIFFSSAGSLNPNPCGCPDWHGCIMRSTVSGEDGIQPYKFSACSVDHFQRWMDQGSALCLLNKPRKIAHSRGFFVLNNYFFISMFFIFYVFLMDLLKDECPIFNLNWNPTTFVLYNIRNLILLTLILVFWRNHS